jgi:hypothetical protein
MLNRHLLLAAASVSAHPLRLLLVGLDPNSRVTQVPSGLEPSDEYPTRHRKRRYSMDHSMLRDKIVSAWAERYPDDQKPIETTEIVDKAFG